MNQNKNGITLIALVITVIVLLILAGAAVSIGLSGDDVFAKANKAKTEWNAKVEEENSAMQELMKILSPNPNVLNARQLNENANTYFGWDVVNYSDYLPESLQDTEWELLYAGMLPGVTEERIYLATKDYIKYSVMPDKDGNKPIDLSSGGTLCRMRLAVGERNGVIPGYSGINDVSEVGKMLNKEYFNYLETNSQTNTDPKMSAIAYLTDTFIWRDFANKFAEYAIGAPTIELLYTSSCRRNGIELTASSINEHGYNRTSTNLGNYAPYKISQSGIGGYFTASPSYSLDQLIVVGNDSGNCNGAGYYSSAGYGLRPVVALKKEYKLEKIKDGDNDVFRIVK